MAIVKHSICLGMPFRILASVACLCIVIYQAAIINYYLANYRYHGAIWWTWWIADAVTFTLFLVAFIASFKSLRVDEEKTAVELATRENTAPGELPLGYIAWLVYAILLGIRVWIIFWRVAQELKEDDFFGPNLLKITIGLSCFVFILLVATHHNASPSTGRVAFIRSITSSVAFDILDTVAVLDVLFIQESHVFLTFTMHRVILTIACLNLALPTLPLLVLSKTRYGRTSLTKTLHALHHLVYLLLINVPLFAIRIVLWHVKNQNISVFLLKNILGIAFSIKTLIEEFSVAVEDVRDGMGEERAGMGMTEPPKSEPERETDINISEAATLPLRHRHDPEQPGPRFV